MREDDIVGDCFAISFVSRQVSKIKDLYAAADELASRTNVIHGEPPVHFSEHTKQILDHTVSRQTLRVSFGAKSCLLFHDAQNITNIVGHCNSFILLIYPSSSNGNHSNMALVSLAFW